MSSAEKLYFIESIILNDLVADAEVISIDYFLKDEVLAYQCMEKIVNGIKKILIDAKNKGRLYYCWLDPQVGQIRVSLSENGDIKKNFNHKIIILNDFKLMLDDIYEECSLIEKNGGIRVFIS